MYTSNYAEASMQSRTLSALLQVRKLRQTALAQAAGVTRQAVSIWMKQPTVNLQTRHLTQLAAALHLRIQDLMEPLPLEPSDQTAQRLRTALLWDHAFKDLDSFAVALVRHDPRALARLTQVFGLYAAAQIAGRCVWILFESYQHLILPARRKECAIVWNLHQNPI